MDKLIGSLDSLPISQRYSDIINILKNYDIFKYHHICEW